MLLVMIVFAITDLVISQKPSPCPDTFSYDPKSEDDRWYGVISLRASKNLTGVWLHITLDRPADLLGNWFGRVSTCDNALFVIRKPEHTLEDGASYSVRFFVKFNPAKAIPSLEAIKLNGQIICSTPKEESESNPTTVTTPGTSQNETTLPGDRKTQTYAPDTDIISDRPSTNNWELSSFDDEDDTGDEFYVGDLYSPQLLAQSRMAPGKKQVPDKTYSCGTIAPKATPLIPNDDETWPGQWPWHAALYRPKGTKLVYICGATLVSDQHVIIPAHCVTARHKNRVLHAQNFLISLGKYNLNWLEPNVQIQDRGISFITVHPEYNNSVYYNDIAILTLSKPVKVTDFVRPCCLWEGDTSLRTIINKQGTIVGWGDDKSKKLMKTEMPILSLDNCFFSESVPDKYYCAGFQNGTLACKVISMGGMVFPREETSGQGTVWQLRGINVYSEIRGPCETSKYTIFTDVTKYTAWIQEVISTDRNK